MASQAWARIVANRQSYYVCPYADFNCLVLPPDAEEKENDYVMLSDIFPTGYHATELALSVEEAKTIKAAIGAADIRVGAGDFRDGLEVELEHGTRYPEANVTNDHPLLTGKIVIAHLKETLGYYRRLKTMELEIVIHKALVAKDAAKLETYLKTLEKEKLGLSKSEVAQLK
jgi:hypothetical protein